MSEAGQRRLLVGSLSGVTTGIIDFMGTVTGPIRRGDGNAPAVELVDPYLDGAKRQRLPRKERTRGYKLIGVHPDHALDRRGFRGAEPYG